MYLNGMGLRAIARVQNIHHTTLMNWVKNVAQLLPNAYSPEVLPEVGELDELETFIGKKAVRTRVGVRRKGTLTKTKQNVDKELQSITLKKVF